MNTAKPFVIDKWQVYKAYKEVKANAGSAGVDGQTIEKLGFEAQTGGIYPNYHSSDFCSPQRTTPSGLDADKAIGADFCRIYSQPSQVHSLLP